jgi:molecular chaperone GrpE
MKRKQYKKYILIMIQDENKNVTTQDEEVQSENTENNTASTPEGENAEAAAENPAAEEAATNPLDELQQKYDALRNDYLRLMADFENYRKNTLKEKQNLLKYGGEETLKKLLPVVDDFERAMASLENATEIEAVKEGVHLIYSKFTAYLDQNGVKPIPAQPGDPFDDSKHDAMTMFPAPTPELKGKIVDCVTKGYTLGDKVMRYAKVVVGQ